METVTHFYSYVHSMHYHATKIAMNKDEGDSYTAIEHFRASVIENANLVVEDSTLAFLDCLKLGRLDVTSSLAVRVLD